MSTTKEKFHLMKRMAPIIATALMILAGVTACSKETPGVVNSVDGPEITRTVGTCNLYNSWSISVDPDGHENETIDARAAYRYRVCMSEAEAKTYKSGDRYPRGK